MFCFYNLILNNDYEIDALAVTDRDPDSIIRLTQMRHEYQDERLLRPICNICLMYEGHITINFFGDENYAYHK